MALVEGSEYPEHLFYDVNNQIWYEPLADGTVRAGFTPWAVKLMGEVLVFTPKRIGRDFEKERSFAVIEGGKWVGAARAAFDGTVVSHNERSCASRSSCATRFGEGWMLIVRPRATTGATGWSPAPRSRRRSKPGSPASPTRRGSRAAPSAPQIDANARRSGLHVPDDARRRIAGIHDLARMSAERSGAQATSRPPDVCGSVSRLLCHSPSLPATRPRRHSSTSCASRRPSRGLAWPSAARH